MRRSLLFVAAGLAAWLAAWPAAAFERQWHLGGGLGAASFADGETSIGPAVGLHGAYGLSDMFDLRLELMASQNTLEFAGQDYRFRTYSAAAGLAYKVDIIEWVPYVALLGGVYRFDGDAWPRVLKQTELGLEVLLGLDYAVSRSFGLGVSLGYHGFLSDPLDTLGDAPYFSALLRAEYRWGW